MGHPGWTCVCGARNQTLSDECYRCDAPRPPTYPADPGQDSGNPRRRWGSRYGLASGTAFLLALILLIVFLPPSRWGRSSVPEFTHPAAAANVLPASAGLTRQGVSPPPYYTAGQPSLTPPPPVPPGPTGPEWMAPPVPVASVPPVYMPPVRLVPPAVRRPAPPPPATAPWPPPGSAGGWLGTTPDAVVERVRASVVLVLARKGSSIRHGAGFPLGPRLLVTCAHTVRGARELLLVTADGRQLRVAGGGMDVPSDLALLQSDGDLPPPLPLAGLGPVPVGERVAVTGFPAVDRFLRTGSGLETDTVPGFVSAQVRRRSPTGHVVESLRIDAAVRLGYSGGPVYSVRTGAVLGVLSFRVADAYVEGYAAPVSAIRALLDRFGGY